MELELEEVASYAVNGFNWNNISDSVMESGPEECTP